MSETKTEGSFKIKAPQKKEPVVEQKVEAPVKEVAKENEIEDRKDKRTRIQGTQQSEMISQRKNDTPPTNFESGGNDTMGGGFGLGAFDPR